MLEILTTKTAFQSTQSTKDLEEGNPNYVIKTIAETGIIKISILSTNLKADLSFSRKKHQN